MLILFEVVAFFIGAVLLGVMYFIFMKMENRILRLILILLVMVFGFIRFMTADAPMLLLFAMAFAVPAAVLVPPFILNKKEQGKIAFGRIFICYIAVSVFEGLLPFILVASGLSMVPFIYWHTPVSNAAVLAVATALDICLAAAIFRLMDLRSGRAKEKM